MLKTSWLAFRIISWPVSWPLVAASCLSKTQTQHNKAYCKIIVLIFFTVIYYVISYIYHICALYINYVAAATSFFFLSQKRIYMVWHHMCKRNSFWKSLSFKPYKGNCIAVAHFLQSKHLSCKWRLIKHSLL